VIRAYIRNQELADQQRDQLELKISAAQKSNQSSQHPLKPPLAVPNQTSSFAGGYWLAQSGAGQTSDPSGRARYRTKTSGPARAHFFNVQCLTHGAKYQIIGVRSQDLHVGVPLYYRGRALFGVGDGPAFDRTPKFILRLLAWRPAISLCSLPARYAALVTELLNNDAPRCSPSFLNVRTACRSCTHGPLATITWAGSATNLLHPVSQVGDA